MSLSYDKQSSEVQCTCASNTVIQFIIVKLTFSLIKLSIKLRDVTYFFSSQWAGSC